MTSLVPAPTDLFAVYRAGGTLRADRIVVFESTGIAWVATPPRVERVDNYIVLHVDQLPTGLRPTLPSMEDLDRLLAKRAA